MSDPHSFYCYRCRKVHHGGHKGCCPQKSPREALVASMKVRVEKWLIGAPSLRWLAVLSVLSGCATTYRPSPALAPFAFTLTPEQCEVLKAERRKYHATQEASTYAAGAGLVCTGFMLGLTDSKTAAAICTGVGGVAEGVSIFTSTQVDDLDKELAEGGCR